MVKRCLSQSVRWSLVAAAIFVTGCKPPAQPQTEGLSSLNVQSGGDLPKIQLSRIEAGQKQALEDASAEAISLTSPFFQLCTGDILGLAFPQQRVVDEKALGYDKVLGHSGENIAGPIPGGPKLENRQSLWATRIRYYQCTDAELDRMLSELREQVVKLAEEKGCRLIGPHDAERTQKRNEFQVTYTVGEWQGHIAVHSMPVEASRASDGMVTVHRIDFNVHENHPVPRRRRQLP